MLSKHRESLPNFSTLSEQSHQGLNNPNPVQTNPAVFGIKKSNSSMKFLKSFDLGTNQEEVISPKPNAGVAKSKHSQLKRDTSSVQSPPKGLESSKKGQMLQTTTDLFAANLFAGQRINLNNPKKDKRTNVEEESPLSQLLKARKSLELLRDPKSVQTPKISNKSLFQQVDPVDKALFGAGTNDYMPTGLSKHPSKIQKHQSPKQFVRAIDTEFSSNMAKNTPATVISNSIFMKSPKNNVKSVQGPNPIITASKPTKTESSQTAFERLSHKVTNMCKGSYLFEGVAGLHSPLGSKLSRVPVAPQAKLVSESSHQPAGGKQSSKPSPQIGTGKLPAKYGRDSRERKLLPDHMKLAAKYGKKAPPSTNPVSKKNIDSGGATPHLGTKQSADIQQGVHKPSRIGWASPATRAQMKPTQLTQVFKRQLEVSPSPSKGPSVPKFKSKGLSTNKSHLYKSANSRMAMDEETVKLSHLSAALSKGDMSNSVSQLRNTDIVGESNRQTPHHSENQLRSVPKSKLSANKKLNPSLLNIPVFKETETVVYNSDNTRGKISLKSRSDVDLKVCDTGSVQRLRELSNVSPLRGLTPKPYAEIKQTIRSRLEEYSQSPAPPVQMLKRSQTELLDFKQVVESTTKPEIIIKRASERSLGSRSIEKREIVVVNSNPVLPANNFMDSPKSAYQGIKSAGRLSLSKFYKRADSYSVAMSNGMSESKSLKTEFKRQMQEDFQDDTSIASKGLILGKILGRGRFGIVRLIVDPAKQNKALVLKCYNKLTLVSANALSSVEVVTLLTNRMR